MSDIEHLHGCYPCMLCGKNYLAKQDFDMHLSSCLDSVSCKIAELDQKLKSVTAEFSLSGSEDSKRSGEHYRSQIDDLKFRLELYGYRFLVGGWISPVYAKFFQVHHCGYCSESFNDPYSLQQHKDGCLKTAMHLKSELHLKIQKIVGDLENASNIGLLQSQLKYLRDSHAFISYKLAVYDGIPCTEHYIL